MIFVATRQIAEWQNLQVQKIKPGVGERKPIPYLCWLQAVYSEVVAVKEVFQVSCDTGELALLQRHVTGNFRNSETEVLQVLDFCQCVREICSKVDQVPLNL